MFPSLKGPRKRVSLHVPQNRGFFGNRRPFPDPYLVYPSGFPLKEPSLQITLTELPKSKMLHPYSPLSFTLQSPICRYNNIPNAKSMEHLYNHYDKLLSLNLKTYITTIKNYYISLHFPYIGAYKSWPPGHHFVWGGHLTFVVPRPLI